MRVCVICKVTASPQKTHCSFALCCCNLISFIDHPQSGVVYNFGCVCMCISMPVWKPWRRKFIFAHGVIPRQYGWSLYWVKVKVTAAAAEVWYPIRSIKHRAMKFACSIGFLTMANRMMWPPSLSCDQKWPYVTKCTHLRVVGVRLEGNLVTTKPAFISLTVTHLACSLKVQWKDLDTVPATVPTVSY